MKLIDLLVRELPKRGGWPEGAHELFMHSNVSTEAYFYNVDGDGVPGAFTMDICGVEYEGTDEEGFGITRNQYQSALAASQKPAWNGEGLPPIGAKVEFFINPRLGYCNDWIPDAGTEMEVVAHKTTTDGNDVAVCYWDEGGAGRSCCFVPESIKPLRSEVDRKRDAAAKEMARHANDDENRGFDAGLRNCLSIYDAIAAGKIPGVKLED